MFWTAWWAWLAGALVLAIMEILAPTFILLGFAVGAGAIGGLLYLGGNAAFFAGSVYYTLATFAGFSMLAWLALRMVFGVRLAKVKTWGKDEDING